MQPPGRQGASLIPSLLKLFQHAHSRGTVSSLRIWLASPPPGQTLLKELRWALLRQPAASARLRAMGPRSRSRFCVLQDSVPAWDPQLPAWQDAVAGLAQLCVCPQANIQRLFCCWTCGTLVAVLPLRAPFARLLLVFPVPPAAASCTPGHSVVGTTALTQLISVQMRRPSARIAGSCGPAACKPVHYVVVLHPLQTIFCSTSGTPAKP